MFKNQNKVIALAFNYRDLIEDERPGYGYPAIFMKSPTSVIHSGEDIRIPPPLHGKVWAEVELAFRYDIAGRFFYGVANDVSAFNVNNMDVHLAFSKAVDTFCPIQSFFRLYKSPLELIGRRMTTTINGKLVQEGNTKDMWYKPLQALDFIRQYITVRPHDLILTGTCKHDKTILQDGDFVEVSIEGLGSVKNRVVYV
jgi:2-keto-4-pentenoate hydratase/2-oxohepta-3-ene-1,7-dioic acid hydratase in catechol pathway